MIVGWEMGWFRKRWVVWDHVEGLFGIARGTTVS
jgi:hypothetical protein